MAKVVKVLIVLVVLSLTIVGAYAWLQGRGGDANGLKTVDYTEEDPTIPDHGIIAVQIHGGPPSEAWYKDITIEELP